MSSHSWNRVVGKSLEKAANNLYTWIKHAGLSDCNELITQDCNIIVITAAPGC